MAQTAETRLPTVFSPGVRIIPPPSSICLPLTRTCFRAGTSLKMPGEIRKIDRATHAMTLSSRDNGFRNDSFWMNLQRASPALLLLIDRRSRNLSIARDKVAGIRENTPTDSVMQPNPIYREI